MAHGASVDLSLPVVQETSPEPVPEDLAAENARLRREDQQLRDTNELLKSSSAFSRRNQAQNFGNDPVHR